MNQRQFSKEAQWLLKEKYQGKVTKSARKDLARLKAGEPVDYLIGHVEFAGSHIDLSYHPLIPRPETEYWTQKAIEEIKKKYPSSPKSDLGPLCLDMFAGSGCVGIAVLQHIPKAKVDFAEKEKNFVKQILVSLEKNGIPQRRFRIMQSDIFSNVKGKYDYIFANPPYVATARWKSVQSSVAQYEPSTALAAGTDGLKYIKEFLNEVKDYLNLGGKIYMEFDSPQKQEIEKLLKKLEYKTWQFHKDQYGKWRFAIMET